MKPFNYFKRCGEPGETQGVAGCKFKATRWHEWEGQRRKFCLAHSLRIRKYGDPLFVKRPQRKVAK